MADLIAELEACPFCGGMAQVRIPTERDGFAAHVSCHCGAQLYGHKRHFANEQEAIAAWNTRTHHAEIAAAVRDAARYRFICPRLWPDDVRDAISTYPTMFPSIMDLDVCREHAQKVSRLIDTAMRAGEGEG